MRLAVTGLGVICSIGRNQHEVWDSISRSESGVRKLGSFPGETFPTDLAAEVSGEKLGVPFSRKEIKRMSRTDLLAVVAAAEALAQADANGRPVNRDRAVVSSGTSTGGLLEGESFYFKRVKRGALRTAASSVLQQPTSGPSDAVAKLLQLKGGVFSNATACASAGAAIGMASDLLRSGHADVAIAGGSDALCRLTYSGFNVLQAVDTKPCTPFDAERQGITLGEGAGYIVIERWSDAVDRGANILAELCGYGATCDAHHPTAPAEDGRGAAAAMREAMSSGTAAADQIDYVNAHGTGTLLNDSAESQAITTVLGTGVPTSSSKSFFGHTLGAAGGIEAVVTIMALQHQVAPPTLRFQSGSADCQLDYIPDSPRPLAMTNAISNTFGFGGSNVSILLRAVTSGDL